MKIRWPWARRAEDGTPDGLSIRGASVSIADPAMIELFGLGRNATGQVVSEATALSLTAVWRAVSLISGTLAAIPLRTIDTSPDGEKRQVESFLDNPSGPGRLTPFEWKELVFVHLLLHGRAFLLKLFNNGHQLIGYWPIHPSQVSVTIDWERAPVDGKLFTVTLGQDAPADDLRSTLTLTSADIQHVTGMSTDGIDGIPPLFACANAFGTALAGDSAAAHMFGNGAMISAIVTADDDLTSDEANTIKGELMAQMTGAGNAGNIAVINRRLKISPWSMTAVDAQFLQSRQYSIEEIARIYGVPPHQLMQTEKATSWGTGIAEQNLGLSRHTLMPWAVRLEQRLTRDLYGARRVAEFDFAGIERPSPKDEIDLLIKQVDAGLMSTNEARATRGLPAVDGGNVLRVPQGTATGPVAVDGDDPEAQAVMEGSDG